MPPSSTGKLRKDLSLFGVYAIALGTTVSGGFFLLPGMVFAEIGPAVIVAFLLAGLVTAPPLLCQAELCTAMPRAGGIYFCLDRAFGPTVGAVSGLGTWISLTLKTAFALVGSGYYIGMFMNDPPVLLIAVCLAIGFGVLNILGASKTTRLQTILVVVMLAILAWFIGHGGGQLNMAHFERFLGAGTEPIVAMTGVVLISYMGLTKVASIAEEVRNPERNIPLGIFLALVTAILIYLAGLTVMVGVVPAETLAQTMTPAADAATAIAGRSGMVVISIAAIASFLSVANAGILSASRYPLAMGRDHILPKIFSFVGHRGTPVLAIVVTVLLIVGEVLLLDPLAIAKYAGTLQLLIFGGLCAAMIVMRESHLASYDPGFKVPLYPALPLFGMAACFTAMILLGWIPIAFALALIGVSVAWFRIYAAKRVRRDGAIYHVFSRFGERRFAGLDIELREIIKEKGLRKTDPFDEIIAISDTIDAEEGMTFEQLVANASAALAEQVPGSGTSLSERFLHGTGIGATPVTGGVALPHLRVDGINEPVLVLARSREGVVIDLGDAFSDSHRSQTVHAIFFLVSPEGDPSIHLRLLAQLASHVEQAGFMGRWLAAQSPQELKEILLRDERFLSIHLREGSPAEALIGVALRDLGFSEECLVAMIHRRGQMIVPRGGSVLEVDDQLTVIGDESGINALKEQYGIRPAASD